MAPRKRRRRARHAPAVAEPPAGVDLDGLPAFTGYAVRRAQLVIWQDFLRAVEGLDVSPAKFSVLAVIAANPGVTQTALAAALAIEKSAMVLIMDEFEARGLARRVPSPADRRARALHLTPRGRTFLDAARERVSAHEARVTACLTPDERDFLLRLLARVAGQGGEGR
jgi:DNA-binding MarR family transcriptional regulator